MPVYANDEVLVKEKEEALVSIVHEISQLAAQANEMVRRTSAGLFNDCTEMQGDLKEPHCLMEELLLTRSELARATTAMQFMIERLGF